MEDFGRMVGEIETDPVGILFNYYAVASLHLSSNLAAYMYSSLPQHGQIRTENEKSV